MNLSDKTLLNILAKSSEAFFLLASSIILVRYLTKAEYGTYLQIMLIGNSAIMFTSLGFPQSVYYFFHRVENRAWFVLQNLILSIVIGAGAGAIAYLLRGKLSVWFHNPQLFEYGWIFSLYVLFRGPEFFREPIMLSNQSLVLNSFLTVAFNTIIYVPLTLCALLAYPLDTLLKVFLASCALTFLMYVVCVSNIYRTLRGVPVDIPEEKSVGEIGLFQQFKYALPIGFSSYIGIVARQIDQYIISVFFLPRDFAVYSRGAMRVPVLSTIQYTINNIMMPQYMESYKKGDIKAFLGYFHRCIEKVAKVNIPVFSFLFAMSPLLMVFLYTEEYRDASPIFRAYLVFLLLNVTLYGVVPRVARKTGIIMNATVLAVFGNIGLSLYMVLKLGPVGAAIATIISYLLSSYYYLRESCRILDVPFSAIFPWGFLGKILAATLIASLPIYAINYYYRPEGVEILVSIAVNGILYTYICAFLMMRYGLVYDDDLDMLSRWLRFDVETLCARLGLRRRKPVQVSAEAPPAGRSRRQFRARKKTLFSRRRG